MYQTAILLLLYSVYVLYLDIRYITRKRFRLTMWTPQSHIFGGGWTSYMLYQQLWREMPLAYYHFQKEMFTLFNFFIFRKPKYLLYNSRLEYLNSLSNAPYWYFFRFSGSQLPSIILNQTLFKISSTTVQIFLKKIKYL